MDNGRVNFKLRVPGSLADEIKHEAWKRGLSMNQLSCVLLRYALKANTDQLTLTDRLAAMGARK